VPERGRVVAVAARQRGDGGRVTSFSVHPSVVSVEGRDLYVCVLIIQSQQTCMF
jgi:hypothetical protein